MGTRIRFFALLALLSLALSACGGGPATSTAPGAGSAPSAGAPATGGRVSFWMKKSLADASNDAITARVKEFEQPTGIGVDLRILPYEDLRTQGYAV